MYYKFLMVMRRKFSIKIVFFVNRNRMRISDYVKTVEFPTEKLFVSEYLQIRAFWLFLVVQVGLMLKIGSHLEVEVI